MPRGIGYGQPQQLRNSSSGRKQYDSFFNPVPIEFLQEQLRGRQGQYDTNFAAAVAAKEQMASQQAALQDLGSKNQIINDTMGNIDKVVKEKYGGDWGRASKEIARMVSTTRQDPFWESSKHLAEQQKVQQNFQLNNPNAWIYQDTLGQSTIDPKTGQVRDRRELTFEGSQRGDYGTSIEKQYADIQANVQDFALQQVNAEGVSGMLKKTRIEEIKDTELKKAATQGVDTFLTNNPDYLRGHMSQGMTEEQVRAKAASDIYGQIRDKAYKSQTDQVMQDKAYFEEFAARAATGTAADGYVTRNSAEFIEMAVTNPAQASRNLRNTQAEIDELPEGELQNQLQAQYDADVESREFMMDTVQESKYAVDIDPYYDRYVKDMGKETPMSKEKFEKSVYDAVKQGELPDLETIEAYKGYAPFAGTTFSNEAKKAGREFTRAMKKFVNNEGKAAINVNVLGGETGRKDIDTDVGRMNNLITDEFKASSSSFTVPYSDRQIGDILENEKKYEDRDPDKDVVRMTDGYMGGKPTYQLNVYNAAGERLGAEYVNPQHTSSAANNIMTVAGNMINSNDINKREIGKNMMMHSVYSPAIQSANIHKNPKGTLKGINHEGNPIKYEKVQGSDSYMLYVDINGTKDYLEKEEGVDANGNPKIVTFRPKNESEMMRGLVALQFPQLSNIN